MSRDSRELGGGAPVAPLPAAAPASLRPTSLPPGDDGSGQVAGRLAARALPPPPDGSQLRSGPAGLSVTCALPPVPGDHCLAGDGVQPGGALRLLAAGVREGAETERERGRGRSRGAEAAQTGLALPLVASLPHPPGPRAVPGSLLDEEDSAAPGDPVSPGPGREQIHSRLRSAALSARQQPPSCAARGASRRASEEGERSERTSAQRPIPTGRALPPRAAPPTPPPPASHPPKAG